MYRQIKRLLKNNFEVNFRPDGKGNVKLTVQEAKNGLVDSVEIILCPMEWGLVEKGITDNLEDVCSEIFPKTQTTP